jgi:hypothetical protein
MRQSRRHARQLQSRALCVVLSVAACGALGTARAAAAPQLGVAKSVVSGPTNNGDGTYTLAYRILVQNSGDESLNSVQVVDDLATTFAGASGFVPTFAVSPDFLLNPGYDGSTDTNVLAGLDALGIGASGTIEITITVTPGGKLGPYDNVAVGSAQGAVSGTPVNDASSDGSNPDANANGDPTDDSVPTSVTFGEAPEIGAAKLLLSGPVNNGDGTYTLTYRNTVQNSGDVPNHDVQITDDLGAAFLDAQSVVVNSVTSAALTINPFFDGVSQPDLLWGIDTLPSGASGSVDFTVTVTPGTQLGPYANNTIASATSAGGQSLSDISADGSVADANGNGDPSDDSTPTSVLFVESPQVGLAKSVRSGPQNNGDGTYTLTYRFHVFNGGDSRIDDLQIEDDLKTTFATARSVVVDALGSSELSTNTAYDGDSNTSLLAGSNGLNAGQSGHVDLALTVTPGAGLGPHANSALLTANSAGGAALSDVSMEGETPDANGNGDPGDDSQATVVTFTESPLIGAAKSSVETVANGDGTYTLRYRIVVENMGDALLNDLQVVDDLASTFAAAQNIVIDELSSSDFSINASYDVATDTDLLLGSDALVSGARGEIDLTLTITPGTSLGPYDNSVLATATSAGGSSVSDVSTPGSEPDANGNGDPTDDNEPTRVTFSESPVRRHLLAHLPDPRRERRRRAARGRADRRRPELDLRRRRRRPRRRAQQHGPDAQSGLRRRRRI